METERDILVTELDYDYDYEPNLFEEEVQQVKPKADSYVQKEIKRFDSYSHNFQEEDYEEYEVVQSYAPRVKKKQSKEAKEFKNFVENQYDFKPEKETFIFQRSKPQNTFSNRTKGRILVYCCAFIALLLSSLCIVNAVNLNTVQLQNAQTQTEISGIDKDLSNLEQSVEDAENEINNSANGVSYNVISEDNSVKIELLKKDSYSNYQSQTNFFDKICNFISNLFGG